MAEKAIVYSTTPYLALFGDTGLGRELWTDPPTTIGGWTDEGAGVYSLTGAQIAVQDLTMTGIFTTGRTYSTTYTISAYVAGNLSILYGASVVDTQAADGTFTITTATAAADLIIRGDIAFNGKVSLVSTREVIDG